MDNPSRSDVVLLGFTVRDDILETIAERSAVLPTQTHKFAWNLVRGIQSAGMRVSLVSALPVPNYPEYPEIIIRSRRFAEHGVNGVTLGFVNLLVLKHLTRLCAGTVQGIPFIVSQHAGTMVVHGVHTPFLLLARLLRRALGLKICLVMTDPPGLVRAVDGRLTRLLKRFDQGIVRKLASGFDGVIALTSALADDFAPGVNKLVMEGFADPEISKVPRPSGTPSSVFRVAYAGGISAEYGVSNLVSAFRSFADPNMRLDLYGRGPLDLWVLEQSRLDERICHHGVVPHSDLMPFLRGASLLVNPRPASQGFVRYSFPSKLLEYLALGVPVVTTRLSGIPDRYYSYLEFTVDDSTEALSAAICAVRADRSAASDRAVLGQRFVMSEKSLHAQGKRIAIFLQSLNAPRQPDRTLSESV
ncbi:Glycosyltransferase involved in cell wall bisynthesis [Cryobacterium psychrotolerans]|uniref:Glycosyltransferase involved in cell wall bisynthesis n=1 Tax=Cryobacterium psychrotolerans TaxID=386301 RepID=A0A1G9BUK8_9MICO|nr:glycosyltransferase [Cryobacterium psychrotolerans]TFD84093.1 glycosyltransferase [Cryobacterium psychrotolerans]SDK43116.1 Glycosyltransferase involved in cell wall bisynthesis [Cryobacterium psychrotolerans]